MACTKVTERDLWIPDWQKWLPQCAELHKALAENANTIASMKKP
jgi:hypothetical protein